MLLSKVLNASTGFLFAMLLSSITILHAQDRRKDQPSQENNSIVTAPAQAIRENVKQGWSIRLDFGVNFLSNVLINPPQGGGDNRFSLGASLNLLSVYNNGKFRWSNEVNLAYGIQKVGSGYLEEFPDEKIPFTKNIDNLRLYTKISQRHSFFSKFYYTLDLFFASQITPTYEDNYIRDVQGFGQPIADFLSPALFQASLGLDYQPTYHWSIFLSPAAYKTIVVLNDDIANDFIFDDQQGFLGSVHGNEVNILPNGNLDFKNFDHQVGAAFRLTFEKEISKKLSVDTNLLLFSNYRRDPDHIDVNWRNEINYTLFRGLQISLLTLLNYDHDTFVTISSEKQSQDGSESFGRRVSVLQQIILRYRLNFDNTRPKIPKASNKGRIYED